MSQKRDEKKLMKLEYLKSYALAAPDDSPPERLMRLFDFNSAQAKKLKDVIKTNLINDKASLNINGLSFIETLNCQLTFVISDKDVGIITDDEEIFSCHLTVGGYEHMIYMMEPFCERDSEYQVYQWLYDLDNEIELLFSPDGQW